MIQGNREIDDDVLFLNWRLMSSFAKYSLMDGARLEVGVELFFGLEW